MKNIFTLLIVLFFGSSMYSQNTKVTGVIKDQSTNKVVQHVLVFNQDYISTESNEKGEFEMSLAQGTHVLSFSLMGYELEKRTIKVLENESLKLVIELKSKSVGIDRVVVSAGKFEQRLGELTVSMDVIKPDLIENKNTTTIDDILQNSPGITIVDGEPQMRGGSGYSFGAGSRVTIMVDDMTMLSGDAGRPSWGFLPVENIEQIEIIKGASSVLYGSSALNGVINIRTGFPRNEPKTKVKAFHGFYNKPQTSEGKYWSGTPMQSGVSVFHSRKIKNLGIVVGANFLGDDGHLGPMFVENGDSITEGYNPFDVNRYEAEYRIRGNVNLEYSFEKVPGLIAGLKTNWLKGESMAGLLWGGNTRGLYSIYEGSATRTKQIIGTVDPSLSYLTSKGAKHLIRGRWQKLDNDNDNDQGNYSDVFFGEYQFHQAMDSIGIKGLKMTGGIVGNHAYSESQLYSGGETNGDNQAVNYAGYVQLDQKLWDKVNLSAGVRYEYFAINEESESKPVFRSGINYQFTEASYLRASFGQGYRFPTIAEKFLETSVGLVAIFPNSEIKSESSNNYEIGLKQGYKFKKFTGFFDLALFYQEYDDFIEFTFGQWAKQIIDPLNGIFEIGVGFKSLNTGKSTVAGAEVQFLGTGEFKNLRLNYTLGYTYSLPKTSNPNYVYAISNFEEVNYKEHTYLNTSSDPSENILKYRIQHIFRSDVEVNYKAVDLGISLRINSKMKNIDDAFFQLEKDGLLVSGLGEWDKNHRDPDYIFDARFAYRFKDRHKASLIVNNVLNHEYSIRPLTIESPRTIVLQYALSL